MTNENQNEQEIRERRRKGIEILEYYNLPWSSIYSGLVTPSIKLKSGEQLNICGKVPKLHKLRFLARTKDKQIYFAVFRPSYDNDSIYYTEKYTFEVEAIGHSENHPTDELFIGRIDNIKEVRKHKQLLLRKHYVYTYQKDDLIGKLKTFELDYHEDDSIANIKKDIEDGWGWPPLCIENYHPNLGFQRLEVLAEGAHYEILEGEKTK